MLLSIYKFLFNNVIQYFQLFISHTTEAIVVGFKNGIVSAFIRQYQIYYDRINKDCRWP